MPSLDIFKSRLDGVWDVAAVHHGFKVPRAWMGLRAPSTWGQKELPSPHP